jgi:hypothetical protein
MHEVAVHILPFEQTQLPRVVDAIDSSGINFPVTVRTVSSMQAIIITT